MSDGLNDLEELKRRARVQQPQQPTPERMHDLLNASIDKIATGWIEQLVELRRNTEQLESLLIGHVTATKANITKLHELGEHVAAEAERGRQVCAQLAHGIEQLNPPAS